MKDKIIIYWSTYQIYFVAIVSFLLLSSGIFHLFSSNAEMLLSKPHIIRFIGFFILLFGIISVIISHKSYYFIILGTLLIVSGLLRIVTPNEVISIMQTLYPRWIHGILLLLGAIMNFMIPISFSVFLHKLNWCKIEDIKIKK